MRSFVDEVLGNGRSVAVEDETLILQIRQALARTGYGQLRRIRVTATPGGRVRLEGRVSSFYLKQVAQTAVLAVPGVKRVENDLQVTAELSVSCS